MFRTVTSPKLAALALVGFLAGCVPVVGSPGGSGGPAPAGPAAPSGPVTAASSPGNQIPTGYFRMQSQFLEASNRCLESNRIAPGYALGGASFMDTCQQVSGQFWKALPIGNGYYRLTSMFLEGENMCLEGSKPFAAGDPLNGAARMDPCSNASGQQWRFIPQGNGYFQLTNMFLEGEGRCLESSTPEAANDPLYGAARMDPCGDFGGQLWKLTPAG